MIRMTKTLTVCKSWVLMFFLLLIR